MQRYRAFARVARFKAAMPALSALTALSHHVAPMRRLALCVSLAMLAGCAQTPAFQRPALPVPAQWPTSVGGAGTQEAIKTHWRYFFNDPRLQALIATALEQNRDLRAAAARVEEARAQWGIVRADRLPTVNLLGQASITRTQDDLDTSASNQRFDLTLSTVSYEVDFWGRIAGLSDAARRAYLSTEEARRAVHLSLVSDVATAYYTLLQMNELTAMARATVASREQTLALIIQGRDIGATFDFELEQAEGLLASSRAYLASLAHQRSVATNMLNYLVGGAPVDLPAGKPLDEQGLDTALAPGMPGEVLLQRPDVMAAEQRLIAAHANIDAARAAFLPKILLTAGVGAASSGLASLFKAGAWAFQPVISLPIFDGGRAEGNLDVAKARKVVAIADYEKTIQLAFREVADQLSARASLASQMRSSEINLKAQQRRLQISRARYAGGMTGYLEVLESEREVVAAQQITAQLRRAQLESAALLYKALGGGTQGNETTLSAR
jgi:multidrug efflux system outer membrane protein